MAKRVREEQAIPPESDVAWGFLRSCTKAYSDIPLFKHHVTVGRRITSVVLLKAPQISNQHAVIRRSVTPDSVAVTIEDTRLTL